MGSKSATQLETGPLTAHDWDFSAIPQSELVACCLWEYARESESIGHAAELHWCITRNITEGALYSKDNAFKLHADKIAARYKQRAASVGFNYDTFRERYWDHDLACVGIYNVVVEHVSSDARPWQSLPPKLRTHFSSKAADTSIFQPLAMASLGDIEKIWTTHNSYLNEVRATPRPPNDDCEDMALWEPTSPIECSEENGRPVRKLCAGFTIDFSRFTDLEIQTAFTSWLKDNRPVQWSKPSRSFPCSRQRGRKDSEYSVALERLGLMRLLHWYSPELIKISLPETWKRFRHKQASFRREIRAATCFFKKIFPFLPAHEVPFSSERLGIWLPQMERTTDDVFREQ